jgi:hypothetical protein
MATGKSGVAKKRGGKKAEANPERDQLKAQLDETGPYILRDFCKTHGIAKTLEEGESVSSISRGALVSFLIGKFDEGEITFNDLYPNDGGDKKEKKKVDVDDDDDPSVEDDDDDDGPHGAAKDDDPDEGQNDDDIDEEVDPLDDDDDLDELKPKVKSKGTKKPSQDNGEKVDVTALENKVDHLVDMVQKNNSMLDLVIKIMVEGGEISKRSFAVLFKLGGLDKDEIKKVRASIAKKARHKAGIEEETEQEDE